MQYIERDGTEHFHTLLVFPDGLTKKVTLLKYFRNYMTQHLLKVRYYADRLCPLIINNYTLDDEVLFSFCK